MKEIRYKESNHQKTQLENKELQGLTSRQPRTCPLYPEGQIELRGQRSPAFQARPNAEATAAQRYPLRLPDASSAKPIKSFQRKFSGLECLKVLVLFVIIYLLADIRDIRGIKSRNTNTSELNQALLDTLKSKDSKEGFEVLISALTAEDNKILDEIQKLKKMLESQKSTLVLAEGILRVQKTSATRIFLLKSRQSERK